MVELQRWEQLWLALGANHSDPALFQHLQTRYAEPWRAYHNWQHIERCLLHFDAAHTLAEHPAEVAIALCFHDAVYEPQRSDNEARSAEWAQRALLAQDIAVTSVQRVYNLILATLHDHAPASPDAALVVDIDLAILGEDTARFAAYNQAIRQEYHWVPESVFRTRRCEILAQFLARPHLYQTAYFYQRFEEQARQNIAAEIGRLLRVG